MAVQKSRQPTGPTQEDYSMPKTIKELKAEVLRLLKENAELKAQILKLTNKWFFGGCHGYQGGFLQTKK